MKYLLFMLTLVIGQVSAEELTDHIQVYCKKGHCIRTDTGEPIDIGDQVTKDGYYLAIPIEEWQQGHPDLEVPEFVPGAKLPD